MDTRVLIALGVGIVIGLAICRAVSTGPVDALRAEAERLRLQLSACGVAAMLNRADDVGRRLKRGDPYWSTSYADVCDAVDREIRLRDKRDAEVREFIGWLSGDIEELHRVEAPRLGESWERFRVAKSIAAANPEVR